MNSDRSDDIEQIDRLASEEAEKKRARAMFQAALVLGFNELAMRVETLGDKVYYRLFREEAHKTLRELNAGYSIEFASGEPDDAFIVVDKSEGPDDGK